MHRCAMMDIPNKGSFMRKELAMRKMTRVVALLLAMLCLLSTVLTVPLAAAEANVGTQPRKVVSVLYDNSKSMKMSSTETENRYEYARYAMQVLMALMGVRSCCRECSSLRTLNLVSISIMAQR